LLECFFLAARSGSACFGETAMGGLLARVERARNQTFGSRRGLAERERSEFVMRQLEAETLVAVRS